MSQQYNIGFNTQTKYQTTPPDKMKVSELVFSMYAWQKLQYFCHADSCEVSGFLKTHPQAPFYVQDLVLTKGEYSVAGVKMDPVAVNEYMTNELIEGRPVRMWWHTHPGNSASPSMVDEDQLSTEFSNCNYFVMFIHAKGGENYCRLRLGIEGTKMYFDQNIPVRVETRLRQTDKIDVEAWQKEYSDAVTVYKHTYTSSYTGGQTEKKAESSGNGNVAAVEREVNAPSPQKAIRLTKKYLSDNEVENMAKNLVIAHEGGNYREVFASFQELSMASQNEIEQYLRDNTEYAFALKGGLYKQGNKYGLTV